MTQPFTKLQWQRSTPMQRIIHSMILIAGWAALIWSFKTISIIPEFLYDAPEQAADLFVRMWPFDWSYYPKVVHAALIETFHIATLGTLLALILALPLAFLSARTLIRSPFLNWCAQVLFVSSRSVNSLIWALLFVAIFGPGALAGVMSIAFRSIGFIGKLFGEALEEAQQGPIDALVASGTSFPVVLTKAVWPQVEPAFWSVALLRWDINIRESAVLGLVGAGGIGVALDDALSNLYWDQVGLIMAVIFVVVVVVEILTSSIRARLI